MSTQIIVSAPLSDEPNSATALSAWSAETAKVESLVESRSKGLFEWDGHDLSRGRTNYVFFSKRPLEASRRLMELIEEGVFPRGSVVGVAEYTDDRTDWTYRVVYPAGLKTFDFN